MRQSSREIDLTETGINIDSLFDVYVQTQRETGKDPGLEERDMIVDDQGNLVRSHKPKEKPKQEQPSPAASPCMEASECPKRKSYSLGHFEDSMSEELEEGEDEGPYVCEYCSDIGFKKEYKPHLCDTCDTCGTCSEYKNDECSGCEYSIYRTGRTYGEELRSLGMEVPLEKEEQHILETIRNKNYEEDQELRMPSSQFTVLDYDHKLR